MGIGFSTTTGSAIGATSAGGASLLSDTTDSSTISILSSGKDESANGTSSGANDSSTTSSTIDSLITGGSVSRSDSGVTENGSVSFISPICCSSSMRSLASSEFLGLLGYFARKPWYSSSRPDFLTCSNILSSKPSTCLSIFSCSPRADNCPIFFRSVIALSYSLFSSRTATRTFNARNRLSLILGEPISSSSPCSN